MSSLQRQQRISQLLADRGECSVELLSRRLGVSGMTVRRDLQTMAADGRAIRTHGGAAPAARVSFDFQFLTRTREHAAAKQAIARTAAHLVREGDSVMLDSGTTTLALACRLKAFSRLTVITTSLPIAAELQFCDRMKVVLLGGVLQPGAPDLAGPLTESNLESLHARLAFIGTDAIDEKGNVYSNSMTVARLLTKMAAAAEQVYVVADNSKLGHCGLARIGHLSDWCGLITCAAPRGIATTLARNKARIIQATVTKERS